MMETIDNLSGLTDVRVEGIDVLAIKFQNIVMATKKKSYDLLDHRKNDFDNDYDDFKTQIDALMNQLQTFVDQQFEKSASVSNLLLDIQYASNVVLTHKHISIATV